MDKAYIRELNFDCDTFADAKESLNTVLQKLLGTMVGCGAKEGSITMKLDVGFRSETIQNYDAEIDAPEREVRQLRNETDCQHRPAQYVR